MHNLILIVFTLVQHCSKELRIAKGLIHAVWSSSKNGSRADLRLCSKGVEYVSR